MSHPSLSAALAILALSCSQHGNPPAKSKAGDTDRSPPGSAAPRNDDKEECPCRQKQQATQDAGAPPEDGRASPDAHGHRHEPATRPGDVTENGNLARVVPHAGLRAYENNGNTLVGVATPSLGAESAEVWRTSLAIGSRTPSHTHATEEIFIVLTGRGRVHVGNEVIDFQAPATVIAPAGKEHFVENTGDVPTDSIVVVGRASEIRDATGKVMTLPWRR